MGSSSSSKSLVVNVGGDGGIGAAAGNVEVTNRRSASGTGGTVLTTGASGHGIFAQSLGGGGGNGSSIVSANFAFGGGQNNISVGVSVGGKGGTGGTGGTVAVNNGAQIETQGENAHGVFAQSIGGGGGNGGLVLAANAIFSSGATASGLATPLVVLLYGDRKSVV